MSRGTYFNGAGIDPASGIDDEGEHSGLRAPGVKHSVARAKSRVARDHLRGFVDLCLAECSCGVSDAAKFRSANRRRGILDAGSAARAGAIEAYGECEHRGHARNGFTLRVQQPSRHGGKCGARRTPHFTCERSAPKGQGACRRTECDGQ